MKSEKKWADFMDWKEFGELARKTMSMHFGKNLYKRNPKGFPKRFDMVSDDGRIIGDAKYLTLVRGVKLPPAKFMEIAGHVWLLENVPAGRRFLVFGNQRRVTEWWLEKYGEFVDDVEFYFIDEIGNIEQLKKRILTEMSSIS